MSPQAESRPIDSHEGQGRPVSAARAAGAVESVVLEGPPGFGGDVEGEILLSADTFSIRYDMDRETGVISRRGHALEGQTLAGRIVYFPAVQGGVAAGWAFLDLAARGLAPAGVLFGRTNPVMVQGLVLADIPVLHRLAPDPLTRLRTGDRVRMCPGRGRVELVARGVDRR